MHFKVGDKVKINNIIKADIQSGLEYGHISKEFVHTIIRVEYDEDSDYYKYSIDRLPSSSSPRKAWIIDHRCLDLYKPKPKRNLPDWF